MRGRFNPRVFVATAMIASLAAGVWFTWAGDLNPPGGPIVPTMKPLSDVEPRIAVNAANTPGDADSVYKITQPGSYFLTDNITGVAAKHGIEITASGVTVDLMAFDLVGVAGSLDGVTVNVPNTGNVAVCNGTVRGWAGDGVDLSFVTNARVAELRVSENSQHAIRASRNAVVTGCAASSNGSIGVFLNNNGVVADCSVYLNGSHGILVGEGCTITGSSAVSNTGTGIRIGSGSAITNCSSMSNTSNGILANLACGITHCTVAGNTGLGIDANRGSTVTNCTVHDNTLDGIRVASTCTVRGNACENNGAGTGDGAGIHATGDRNRIEGNNCTRADRGIDVDAGGNFIIRNSCSGNFSTNWDIVAGNICLVVQGVAGAAILGNSGGVAPGSTDPNANFTY